ncbi:hypothetical protein HYH03_011484 [Edaphochlamys debaryana]|uniref:DUF559 domain-containing protein n=1 Tax=Edaphochlamys debaryana TaxID=47281 RepID=A0A835XUI5_9CHLO|nr:hypothetical protein HYH03_011484 [Edaphochlamys debaryana]|eukprot:KAG2490019.1 hypothetical protein HYH03_011484 [Edaphochlamys debaryana]
MSEPDLPWINARGSPGAPRELLAARAFRELQELLYSQVAHEVRRPTGDKLAVIDIAVKGGADQWVALMLVHEEMQCSNSKQLWGSVHVQRQVLEKNGWDVRYLYVRDLERLERSVRPLFIADLLRSVGVRIRRKPAAGPGQAAGAEQGAGAGAGEEGPTPAVGKAPRARAGPRSRS